MSILDQIITRREEEEKQNFQPYSALQKILGESLAEKEHDIIRRRFGISGRQRETLEEIGRLYGVTRERIRQIENQAIHKILQSSLFQNILSPLEHFLTNFFSEHGGALEANYLSSLLFLDDDKENHSALRFMLTHLFSDRFEVIEEGKDLRAGWKLRVYSRNDFEALVKAMESIFSEAKSVFVFEEVYRRLREKPEAAPYLDRLRENGLKSILELSKIFSRNPFDEYGLSSFSDIRPKRMHDRILLILRKEKKPMHFRDIAKKIEEVFHRKAHPPTIHNELIFHQEYVLVGRGVYALEEWGYKKGVVADIVQDVLKNADHPMTFEEIVKRVLEQRMVKRSTIYIALTRKDRFRKLPDEKYALVISPHA